LCGSSGQRHNDSFMWTRTAPGHGFSVAQVAFALSWDARLSSAAGQPSRYADSFMWTAWRLVMVLTWPKCDRAPSRISELLAYELHFEQD
jgi:hypothetical protein